MSRKRNDRRNGVIIPGPETLQARAWAIFDEALTLEDPHTAAVREVLARLPAEKPSVISTWFGNWKRSKRAPQ